VVAKRADAYGIVVLYLRVRSIRSSTFNKPISNVDA
jgi:hypothetical protein